MSVVERDYSITGPERPRAISRGLADAQWYKTPVPRETMRRLMARRDGPAIRDTVLWFALLGGFGYLAHRAYGTWWMIPAFAVYGTLYGSVSDSRWHECGHRTAFRTNWMNDAVYFLASFMVFREAVSWRWSHVRHHSDTIIVGRDPEIAAPRPIRIRNAVKDCFGLVSNTAEARKIIKNLFGRFTSAELDYLPEGERPKAILTARIDVLIWVLTVAAAVGLRSPEPLLFVVGPSFYGKWLLVLYGLTQHAGLAEDTLDHRLNSRTVRMNRLHRYLYWNMNFHVEHHMFPTVPFHALPALHEVVKGDCPPMYAGFKEAYYEIWSVSRRQRRGDDFFADRTALLPTPHSAVEAPPVEVEIVTGARWFDAGAAADLVRNDVIRFDLADATYAIYRLDDGSLHATDGLCTHAEVHLCDGLVRDGQIECPKHNGRFDLRTGEAVGRPAKVALVVHEVREQHGRLELRPTRGTGGGRCINGSPTGDPSEPDSSG